ncbi:MAG TPA: gluconokinase [Solirubrobacteraceae bacterium]|nr:gluconokinase [Solirubrobacteraceae bacterium]
MGEAVVLAVDLGTTATKVRAIDARGATHAAATAEHALDEPAPGAATQDPDAVLRATLGAMQEAAEAAADAGAEVAGLAFSSAMHSVVGLDGDGEPLTPVLTWADTRATEQAERLRERPEALELHRRTGTPVHPMAPLAKLVWLRECEPELFSRVRRWVGIKELLLARLTGACVMDHSVASGTGLMDLERLDWDDEALGLAGVERASLPELVPTTDVLEGLSAEGARAAGLPRETRVVVGAGDGPLANLGLGVVRPGVAGCSIGTSGALRVTVERPGIDPEGRVFCYALVPGRWVVGGALNSGGVVLRWAGEALAPDLGDEPAPALLELAADAPAGSGGLLMLPYLFGERAPQWSALPRGAYVGLTHHHRREHLVRAALEGVCLQMALVLASLRDAGNDVHEVRATGGFARSPLWKQMLTDALGLPVGFAADNEGSALGAALLGMEALGLVESIDVASELVEIREVLRPAEPDAAVYEALGPVFAGLSDALAPAFAALRDREPRPPAAE